MNKDKKRRTIYEMPFKQLIAVLDKEWSRFIRLKATAPNTEFAVCATCEKIDHWKNQTLGHYITRARISVRWDERNTACQCRYCNLYMGGLPRLMRRYLAAKFGEEEIRGMEEYSRHTKTENADSLRSKIVSIREEIRRLEYQKDHG
jgi:hypothetical protein